MVRLTAERAPPFQHARNTPEASLKPTGGTRKTLKKKPGRLRPGCSLRPNGKALGAHQGRPDYLKSCNRICGAWLAIESAWAPNCCCTCRACSRALSLARSASTRLPTPEFNWSVSCETKVAWLLISLDCEPRLPSAWL